MDRSGSTAQILVENVAGGRERIGSSFEDLRRMLEGLDMGVCLDTCHAFAAGHPLHLDPGAVLDEFDEKVGIERLKALHLNDSFGEFESHLDHHQHIGQGHIGLEGFRRILGEPRIQAVPGILETPQRATDDPADDVRNIGTVRDILGGTK
jgi:deoxyribonuclease-4